MPKNGERNKDKWIQLAEWNMSKVAAYSIFDNLCGASVASACHCFWCNFWSHWGKESLALRALWTAVDTNEWKMRHPLTVCHVTSPPRDTKNIYRFVSVWCWTSHLRSSPKMKKKRRETYEHTRHPSLHKISVTKSQTIHESTKLWVTPYILVVSVHSFWLDGWPFAHTQTAKWRGPFKTMK